MTSLSTSDSFLKIEVHKQCAKELDGNRRKQENMDSSMDLVEIIVLYSTAELHPCSNADTMKTIPNSRMDFTHPKTSDNSGCDDTNDSICESNSNDDSLGAMKATTRTTRPFPRTYLGNWLLATFNQWIVQTFQKR